MLSMSVCLINNLHPNHVGTVGEEEYQNKVIRSNKEICVVQVTL